MHTFLIKSSKNFDEAQWSYFLTVLSLKIFLFRFFLFAMKLSYLLILGYFNTTVGEYKVIYPDGTTDYVTKDDFDGANCYSYKVCCYKKRSVQ